jgi:hydrogenase nickel incorporation protein HypA/HybF
LHEVSISHAIADAVLKESAKQEAKKILRVELEIGQLSLLNPDQVEFWLKLAFEKTPASEAELEIEVVKPEVLCSACGYTGTLETVDDPLYHFVLPVFKCPRCGSGEITVKRGKECRIKKIEILA